MPATYRIDAAAGVVYSTASGILTDADLLDHQNRLQRDPLFRPDLDQIFDFSGVTRVDLTAAAVRQLADRNLFGVGSRRAFVVRTPTMLGMMRMYQIMTEESPDELRVQFGSLVDARRWLGLPPPSEMMR